MNPDPIASRPHMPGYFSAEPEFELLPWSWAVERLAASRNYWISTVAPDGRPHAMPVWAVWLDNRLYFSTGAESRKVRNLQANPRCTASTERADEAVIIEGTAQLEDNPGVLTAFVSAYNTKYSWEMEPEGIWRVTPAVAFGFIEAADQFGKTATRWTFE